MIAGWTGFDKIEWNWLYQLRLISTSNDYDEYDPIT